MNEQVKKMRLVNSSKRVKQANDCRIDEIASKAPRTVSTRLDRRLRKSLLLSRYMFC